MSVGSPNMRHLPQFTSSKTLQFWSEAITSKASPQIVAAHCFLFFSLVTAFFAESFFSCKWKIYPWYAGLRDPVQEQNFTWFVLRSVEIKMVLLFQSYFHAKISRYLSFSGSIWSSGSNNYYCRVVKNIQKLEQQYLRSQGHNHCTQGLPEKNEVVVAMKQGEMRTTV